jgi:hypothetical protein
MSEVKVNKISPRSGTEVTLGDSGDTFTIPAGATINNQGTATNFGATGSASWVTTVKTSTFTAVAGEGYFINTTGGAVTVNLPAGTAGAVVAVKDYAGTFDTNAVTLAPNGSDKIGGSTDDVVLSEEGLAITLVFIDSTQGWLVTDSGLQSEAEAPQYIAATGGTVTTVDTNFKVHTFTGPGTFCVSSVGNASGSNEISYMVVAGGGAGGTGTNNGGGGGAGGFREGKSPQDSYTSSPIACTSGSNNGLPVSVQGYPIVVGGGAPAPASSPNYIQGASGSNSTFSTITSTGGGGGGAWNSPSTPNQSGTPGGSGGGSGSPCGSTGGTGNTPPVSPSQGNPGGMSGCGAGGAGGGGAGAVGAVGASSTPAGCGGAGIATSITGSPVTRAGGGGGGYPSLSGAGLAGSGGGGAGTASPNPTGTATSGTINTGGGGGGNGTPPGVGGGGGSGIVIIRYKFQN